MNDLPASYRECARVSRRAASNFYWSFWMLPRQKRLAMFALYAFSRVSDDIVDDESRPIDDRRVELERWRNQVLEGLAGEPATHPLLPAICDTVSRFEIPTRCLMDVLDGVAMDLDSPCFRNAEALEGYCRLVASAVGAACLHIWGFRSEQADVQKSADACGIAFQWTNILRDLKEDAQRGRIYLPRDELSQHPGAEEAIRQGQLNEAVQQLVATQIARVRSYYQIAEQTTQHVHRDGRRMLQIMLATYRRLLDKIEQRGGDVFTDRIRIGRWERIQIVLQACLNP